jgi:hypothetical protein
LANGGGNGSANTGGGGGGVGAGNLPSGGTGGSGIVVLKFSDQNTLTVGAGLTSTNETTGGFRIYSFTQGSGTVTFS